MTASSSIQADMPVIQIRGVNTRFGDTIIHRAIDLDVEAGQILGLVGGSGSGKTTLLREIVGLLAPNSGSVRLLAMRFWMPIPRFGVVFAADSVCCFNKARCSPRCRSMTTLLSHCASCACSKRESFAIWCS